MIIGRPADLDSLSAWPGFRARGLRRIRLAEEASLDPAARQAYESRLNRHYFACGCDAAALGLISGAAGWAAWLALRGGGFPALSWRDLWLGLAVSALASLAGRLIGLALASLAFDRAVRELQREWRAESGLGGADAGLAFLKSRL